MACSQKAKIIYFDGKGRAETARLLLAQAGVDFDDERVPFGEVWQKKKAELDLAYGLPAFEIKGERYFQSLAIVNYIARTNDLYGKTAEDQLKIDIIGQCLHDVASKLPVFAKDDKEKKLDELFEKTYPPLLKRLEKFIPDKGFIINNKVSLADIGIFRTFEAVSDMRAGSLDKYTKLKRIYEDVAKLPNIAAWVKKRPKTEF